MASSPRGTRDLDPPLLDPAHPATAHVDSTARTVSRRTALLSLSGAIAASVGLAAPARAASARAAVPPWAAAWRAPVYDLRDFLRRVPAAHFPRRSVMLTIDDGPSAEWTPHYLRLLERHGVTATFNLIGSQVLAGRTIVRATASEGHRLSNHTWTHDELLPQRSPRDIRSEILRTNEVIHQVTGVTPTQFRSPGGAWGPRIFAELARQQMMPVGWDVDPRDWARPGTPAISASMLAARPGDIVLCHDGGGDRSQTFAALREVIPSLQARGFHFVTLP